MRWRPRSVVLVLVLVVVALIGLRGQAPPAAGAKSDAPPVLAEVDRLRILNAAQAVELWTLKLQAAAVELQKARADVDRLVTAAAVPGWQLNERLDYVKATPPGGKGGK